MGRTPFFENEIHIGANLVELVTKLREFTQIEFLELYISNESLGPDQIKESISAGAYCCGVKVIDANSVICFFPDLGLFDSLNNSDLQKVFRFESEKLSLEDFKAIF